MVKPEHVVSLLSQSSAYPDRPATVAVVETHISWLFLTDRFAYKLKKPVKFEFLDFSSPVLRHQACLDELRLNRRLAPDVYIDVIPVTEDSHNSCLQLGGNGRAIDWVVHMRRLPADKALDRVLRENRLTPADARNIATFLAEFYARLPSDSVRLDDHREALDRHIRANQTSLIEALHNADDLARIRRIHGAQLRFLCVQGALIDSRVEGGRIVDGHGDLRPEHIYLQTPPAVIDCIEFSDELRRVDIADELNFLAMECERMRRGDFGQLVLAIYQEACGDPILGTISSFYRSYRACVRAKVALLQGEQHASNRRRSLSRLARQYLDLADQYTAELGRPCLLVVFGLMGAGKSTLAKKLAETFGIDVLSTDHIRRKLLGTSSSPANYGDSMYRSELRIQVYEELLRQGGRVLDNSQSVILDGTFLTRGLRQRAYDLGRRHGAAVINILCECPRESALARIQERAKRGDSESEAREDLYDAQVQEFQPLGDDAMTIQVDTTVDLSRHLKVVCDALRSQLFSST